MGGYSKYFGRPNARVLPDERVTEAEQLLASGKPFKRVLKITGMHHRTLEKIKAGQHPLQITGQRKVRCPGCGGKQKLPCRVCSARQIRPSAA
jgi:hypothetical protein